MGFILSPDAVAAVDRLGTGRGRSTGDVLYTVFALMVHRYCNQDDIVVARAGDREFAGVSEQLRPVRSGISERTVFEEFLEYVSSERTGGAVPAVQENSPGSGESHPESGAVGRTPSRIAFREISAPDAADTWQEPDGSDRADILWSVRITDSEAVFTVDYDASLFHEEFAVRMAKNYLTLLDDACRRPSVPVYELRLVGEEEEHHLLETLSGTALPYDDRECVHTLFEAQARRTPDAPALEWQGEQVTYRQLDERADALAAALLAGPVRPGDRVGVSLTRTPRMVTLLLAILKSGCAYVPLDPAYPADRLTAIAAGASLAAVVFDRPEPPEWVAALDAVALPEAELWRRAGAAGPGAARVAVSPSAVSHLIHTSGSTGTPKGVVIHHRNVVALLAWARETYTPDEVARVLFGTSLNFDLSVFEMWCPLTAGGCVVVVENVLALTEQPDLAPTLVNSVPSAVGVLVRRDAVPASCRVVNVAGEPLSAELVASVLAHSSVRRVFNLYGPSEDTTYSTYRCFEQAPASTPCIGVTLPNSYAFLADPRGRLVPQGAVGEVLLGGDGLSSGYLGDPERTAEAFVDAPDYVRSCRRVYRTGDLAVWTEEGELRFMGRRDNQVKVRGHRIELSEVEAVAREVAGVRDAAALAVRHDDDTRIVCYVESAEDVAAPLAAHLAGRLPQYAQPARTVVERELPLLPNGKLDRRALAARPVDWTGTAGAPPAVLTPGQTAVAAVWTEVLGITGMAAELDFFSVGGHSLLANILAARLSRDCGVEVRVADVYEHRTLAQQAVLVAERRLRAPAVGPGTGSAADRLAAAKRALRESGRGLGVPGAAFAAHVDGVTRVARFGVDDLADGRPRSADSRQRATCLTKVALAYVVMMMVDRGLLELDAPLEKTVPEATRRAGGLQVDITMRQLLSHSSGIDDSHEVWKPVRATGLAEYVAGFREYGQLFEPGRVYAYSACATSIVALVIERLLGMPWRHAVNRMLLVPLGIRPVPDSADAERYYGGSVATGHLWDGTENRYLPFLPGPQTIAEDAPGPFSVCLTVEEIAQVAVLGLNDGVTAAGERLLSADLAREMRTPQVGVPGHHFMHAWGLGWLLFAPDVFGFISNGSGHHNFVQVFPGQRTALVLQANAYPSFGLYEDVAKALTGYDLIRSGQELTYDLDACTGEYRSDGYRLLVDRRGDRLEYRYAQRQGGGGWRTIDAGELAWGGTGGFTAVSDANVLAGSISFVWPEDSGRPEFVRMGQRLATKIV